MKTGWSPIKVSAMVWRNMGRALSSSQRVFAVAAFMRVKACNN